MLNIANPANPPARPCRADPPVNPPLRTPPDEEEEEEAVAPPGVEEEAGLRMDVGFLSSPNSLVMFLSRNDMSRTPRRSRRSASRFGLELLSLLLLLLLLPLLLCAVLCAVLCVVLVAVAMDLAQAMTAGQLRECASPTARKDSRRSWRWNTGAGKNWGSRRATNSCSCDSRVRVRVGERDGMGKGRVNH